MALLGWVALGVVLVVYLAFCAAVLTLANKRMKWEAQMMREGKILFIGNKVIKGPNWHGRA